MVGDMKCKYCYINGSLSNQGIWADLLACRSSIISVSTYFFRL